MLMVTNTVPQRTLPGPSALPLLGSGANLLKLFRDPCTYSRWLHDTYGDVVAMAQGDPTYVFAFGHALNFQLLSQPALFEVGKGKILKGTKDTALGRLLLSNLLNMNGEHHKLHRHLMQPAFHTRQVGLYHDDILAVTRVLLGRWRSLAQTELTAERNKLAQR